MLNGMPVIDAVVHAFDFSEENYANKYGEFFAQMVSGGVMSGGVPGYVLRDKQAYLRDWSIEDAANVCFLESPTDLAGYHVLPVNAFVDGGCSLEKALEARRRWPKRFFFYIAADPMQGKAAIEDMQTQYDALEGDVVGVKLYPNSWVTGDINSWRMDDPKLAYPVFAKALDLGLKVAAIHKAVPLGPVEMSYYKVDDIDRAAMDFPDLNFEIVHGGMAFVEETAWQLARFSNVYVNLESTSILAARRPALWERCMASFLRSQKMARRVVWGTGGFVVAHPKPLIDAFQSFQFSEQTRIGENLPQVTEEVQRWILAENFAEMTGIDLQARLEAIKGDEFDQRRAELQQRQQPLPPFSTAPTAEGLFAA
ncbi:MAG: amidohydrolase family protein [Sphingobium sp.]